ncbi:MAG: NADPH:quinone oxidoreductase family protein [Parvularculaceae bacterium]|nr:NADPH:quinone oxidoreductase family protein [Parvularculaceae bacterium]
MKAMMSTEPGGPDSLKLIEAPTPEPGPGQIRIAVKAAGVNFPDTLIIRDMYQFRPPRPFAPGGEVAGLVDAVGEGVTQFRKGDRVLAMTLHGGYASHLVVDAPAAAKIPDTMPFDEAAGFLMTYGTSHYALKDRAMLKRGESLFILGAAGGVGAAAIEIGKAMGAKVIAGVSSPEKAAFARDLGADDFVIYPKEIDKDGQKILSNQIKAACASQGSSDGANVVYDAVGGDYAEPAVRALAWEGRFLVVGFPAGIPKLPLNLTLLKSCQIIGVFWGAFTMRDPKRHGEHVAELFNWYKEGLIRPRITAHFALEDAGEALKLIEKRKVRGKAVLTIT